MHRLGLYIIALLLGGIDRWLKVLAVGYLNPNITHSSDRIGGLVNNIVFSELGQLKITSFFNLMLVYNRGAAFGMLQNSAWAQWFFIAIAIIATVIFIIILEKELKNQKMLTCSALVITLGGVWGNLYDRICYGYVIDYLQFHWHQYYWPTFNFADILICVGIACWLLADFNYANKSQ